MNQKSKEEKKNLAGQTVLVVSSVVVIVIAAFFIIKLFTANPLEGTWTGEDNGVTLEITKSGDVTITGLDAEDVPVSVKVEGSVDKKSKVFTIRVTDAEVDKAVHASDGEVTQESVLDVVEPLIKSYDYSVDQDTLTLTEREYGDQIVFVREETPSAPIGEE